MGQLPAAPGPFATGGGAVPLDPGRPLPRMPSHKRDAGNSSGPRLDDQRGQTQENTMRRLLTSLLCAPVAALMMFVPIAAADHDGDHSGKRDGRAQTIGEQARDRSRGGLDLIRHYDPYRRDRGYKHRDYDDRDDDRRVHKGNKHRGKHHRRRGHDDHYRRRGHDHGYDRDHHRYGHGHKKRAKKRYNKRYGHDHHHRRGHKRKHHYGKKRIVGDRSGLFIIYWDH